MAEPTAYQKFAEKMMHKDSKWLPKILQAMINDDQARLLISLPGTVPDLAKKLDRPAPQVESDLKDMFRKGLTFKKEKGSVTTWRAAAHLAQFHDASILWPEATPKFYGLWKKYMEEEWPHLAKLISKALPRPFTRVIPVQKSLDPGRAQVLGPEDVREMVKSASRVAVTKCTCRLTMQGCDAPVEVCLQINKGADYTVERGSGREVTKEEALEIVDQTEEAGLIHVIMNKASVGHFICNCCGCCCQSFTMLISDDLPLCDPSRWRPEVDADKCSACGECEDRCYFGAIVIGDDDAAVVDDNMCMGCGQCAIGCSEQAITMIEARAPDFIPA